MSCEIDVSNPFCDRLLTIYKRHIFICELPTAKKGLSTQRHLKLNNKRPKTHLLQCPVTRPNMLPDALAQPVTKCLIASRFGTVAFLVLLILSATATYAQDTTVEHDLHIVHNVDNRSPEIDPFWYVGRGVRPIGRFGKRQNAGGLQPVVRSLELLLNTLRNKESLRSTLAQDDSDWLP